MEISVEKAEASDIPKKPRSLDLQSIYVKKSRTSDRKPRARKEVALSEQQSKVSRRKLECTFEESGEVSQSKKPARKEVSLSSLGPASKKQRSISNVSKLKVDFISCVQEREDTASGSGAPNLEAQNGNTHCVGSEPYPQLSKKDHRPAGDRSKNKKYVADGFIIPKRPRGISKWRKAKDHISFKITTSSSFHEKANNDADDTKSSGKENLNLQSLDDKKKKKKKKKKVHEYDLNGFHKDDFAPCTNVGNGSPSKNEDRKIGRRKEIFDRSCLSTKKKLVDGNGDSATDSLDGEDNLEVNAARMLSSRFDPSCTVSSEKRTACSAVSVKGSSFLHSDHNNPMDSHAEAFSVDAAGRVLRPRRQNGKSFARKRRHFYEVCSKDIEPYCVVRQRIRVFWPLDKSWYFGLVKDYDPVTRLHHIKYDDRDEEWINLQKERVKLLLFPSEVSSKFNFGKPSLQIQSKSEDEANTKANSYRGRLLESEPIISWLMRTTRQVSSSPSCRKKRHIRFHSKNIDPSLFSEPNETMSIDPLDKKPNKIFSTCNELEQKCGPNSNGVPERERNFDSKDWKLPYVYFRKRFRYKKDGLYTKAVHAAADGRQGCSINILAIAKSGSGSIGHSTKDIGEFNEILSFLDFKEEIFQLNLPTQSNLELAFRKESFWLNQFLYILYQGKMVCAWPFVRMEVFFIDNILGLRFLFFEGCLKRAVSLLCLIITKVDQHVLKSNFTKPEMPCLSIEFRISRMNNLSRNFLFVLSISKMESSRWRYFEAKLKNHCRKDALATAEYMCSNTQDFPSNEILLSPIESVEKFCVGSNIFHRLNLNKMVDPDLNSVAHYSAQECIKPFPCSLFLANGPSFSFGLYRRILIDKDTALGHHILISSKKIADNTDMLTSDGCSSLDDPSKQARKKHDLASSLSQPAANHIRPIMDALPACSDDSGRSTENFFLNEINVIPDAVGGCDLKITGDNGVVQNVKSSDVAISQFAEESFSEYPEHSSFPDKLLDGGGHRSRFNANKDETQLLDEDDKHSLHKGLLAHPPSNLVLEMHEHAIHSPTAPLSMWYRNRHTSLSRTFIHTPKLSSEELLANGFTSRNKRPRTPVSYAQLSGTYDHPAKSQVNRQKVQPHKKVKTHIAGVSSDCPRSPRSYSGSLACDANVLITHGDKCWREVGAKIHLDCDDQKNWRLCVKVSGVTKYVYKAHHVLQPGTTNRFTHAMMWKGGKEWVLEFTDRNQWHIFKQIHVECFNQNIRAASIKNIPIPGVHLLSDVDDNSVEVPFVRNSLKYFRQIGTEVDLALNPSYVLYDMDSEDEEWIYSKRVSVDARECVMPEITEAVFERIMDMFEKLAYTRQCEELTNDDIENHMADVGPSDLIKIVYDHWRDKRKKKGFPLVRQFQPPLWERYQQELKEWESNMNRMPIQTEGCQNKAYPLKKPPMFAFCLRPRGLEIPNKGSKQRSHKKLIYNGHHSISIRGQEGCHSFGRKLDGVSVGELTASSYESSDSYHGFHSRSNFSPRDTASTESMYTNDGSERWSDLKFYRSTSRKIDAYLSPRDPQGTPSSCNQRSRNGINRWSSEFCEWPSTKQTPVGFPRYHPDMDEFRLREATSAAQHALNMAKLKREKAQWLLHKADLALHKATVALIAAEAIKSSEDVNDKYKEISHYPEEALVLTQVGYHSAG